MQQMRKGKTQVEESGIGAYFAPRTTPGSQPSIKSFLATKEAKENVDMSIGRWLYDTYEWWQVFGGSALNLQMLAVRILSQTCSSFGCEHNWIVLEHQCRNDLVYVHYNLRLKQMYESIILIL
ncbi:hypothetical protein HHK36_030155 [Tetracentron sinense]|uniref:HAT C-terminal dimerisation domain-containing protein n=1 Tax=Tetracentron sinense TaxID=13715 RepID=A0A835D2E2_TETSI|nr:hypothetical protein HHK36_030155 [Tetracentron sinense]